MSYFVTSFLIQPVLDQARRLTGNASSLEDDISVSRNTETGPAGNLDVDGEPAEKVTESVDPRPGASQTDTMDGAESQLRPAREPGAAYDESAGLLRLERAESNSSMPVASPLFRMSSSSPPVPGPLQSMDAAGDARARLSASISSAQRVLPEDDGMSSLRKKIMEIQKLNVSTLEKARRMHAVMAGQEVPLSSGEGTSFDRSRISSVPLKEDSSLTAEVPSASSIDRLPTYWQPPLKGSKPSTAKTTPAHSRRGSIDGVEMSNVLGCPHYKRNVKLQCFTCHKWYTCRFCHDEAEDHSLVRKLTRFMLCMLCGSAQEASGTCNVCAEDAACYYCDICKLWDNDAGKQIYHCDDCGICRIGAGLGKDFYHCSTCNVCLSIKMQDAHRCIERSTDCDCPICGEYMFTSPKKVVFMKCSHTIHYTCYREHMQNSFKCPICSRSIINMEMTFRHLDEAIASQPMPSEFRDTKALVYCNDCCTKSTVSYHWMGLKCGVCDSYNTAQIRISSANGAQSAAELDREESLEPAGNIALSGEPAERSRGRSIIYTASPRRNATSASNAQSRATTPDRRTRPRTQSASIQQASCTAGAFLEGNALFHPPRSDQIQDDDRLDFWGGDASKSEDGESEDSDASSKADPMEEDEDYDDELSLPGHR